MCDEEMHVMPIQMAGQRIMKEEYSNERFEEFALTRIREMFVAEGTIRPMAEITVNKDPETKEVSDDSFISLVMMPLMGFDTPMKELFAKAIRLVASDLDGFAYMFVSEVWMVMRGLLEPLKTQPADAPDRQECVYVLFEFKNPMKSKMYTALIKRPTEETVELDEWVLANEEGHMGGRFTGVFKTNTDVQ